MDVASRAPISLTTGSKTLVDFAASVDPTVNEMSVNPFSLTFWTMTSMLMFASAMVLKTFAAMPGLSGTPGDGDFGLVLVNRDAADDDIFHFWGFFFHNGS